jgi:hypothetical protein
MRVVAVLTGCLRVLLSGIRMFLAAYVVALAMMFGGGAMGFGGAFMMFGGLVVFIPWHLWLPVFYPCLPPSVQSKHGSHNGSNEPGAR